MLGPHMRSLRPGNILLAMFCLGAFSLSAQVLFMREMLVAIFGSELSIAVILSCWLLGIGLGAWCARYLLPLIHRRTVLNGLLPLILLFVALCLPAQVLGIRTLRLLLRVPVGEYIPFRLVLLGTGVLCLPICLSIGLFFPLACRNLADAMGAGVSQADEGRRIGAVSLVYTIEALGSMAGGIVVTYLLLPHLSGFRILLLASAIGLVGCAAVVRSGRGRDPLKLVRAALGMTAALVVVAVLVYPPWLGTLEQNLLSVRWRGFGVLPAHASAEGHTRVVASLDTRYQNLAMLESDGQFALYGNGEVMSVFPDPIAFEHAVHFIMAQNPRAGRVLLLGGNPIGTIPELLKYPLEEVVYVELDPGAGELLCSVMGEAYEAAVGNPRVRMVVEDGPRYLSRCREQFDVVIVDAPEPVTAAANRFYTREFFESVKRVLGDSGIMVTGFSSSERLQLEARDLGATLFQTACSVFPTVLITAETRNRLFASPRHPEEAGITFDRDVLYERSRDAGITAQFFRPEYFLAADEISQDKTEFVRRQFTARPVALNSALKPVAYFQSLMLWSRISGSGVGRTLSRVSAVSGEMIALWVVGMGIVCLLIGLTFMVVVESGRGKRQAFFWVRLMTCLLIGSTGFFGMAAEVILISLFQSLHGYVYSRVGMIVAMFMLGLVLGAPSGRKLASGGPRRVMWSFAAIECLLFGLMLAVPVAAGRAVSRQGGILTQAWMIEVATYLTVALTAWAVGAEFPLGNRMYCEGRGSIGAAAAMTDAADHLGAAAGALTIGVVLVPVLGITASCYVLAATKVCGLLLLASAALATGTLMTRAAGSK